MLPVKRIQHQKIQQLEGNEEDDGEEDMVEEETASYGKNYCKEGQDASNC
jgi:hypothetical protein